MSIPVITIIGKSKSGKTTLMEKLIRALREQGYRVGTVKHHAHAGFEIDKPGKDSWRHAQAGSRHVVIVSPDKVASYRMTAEKWPLERALALFDDVDLVLVEGYARARMPAVEIVRAETGDELIGTPEQRIAIVTDLDAVAADCPRFGLEDIAGLAALIAQRKIANP